MRSMNLPVLAILLAMTTLIVTGCDKEKLLSANSGAATVHPGFTAVGASTDTLLKVDETRGALLYSTHMRCVPHIKVHWREQRLATDMDSLKFQVRRWQASIGLGWTEDEIADVVRHLNAAYYGFQDADQKGILEKKKPLQTLRNNQAPRKNLWPIGWLGNV
jgi:hypothetical protein